MTRPPAWRNSSSGIDPATDAGGVAPAGSVLHALFIGIIVKWFMDPKQALSARELTEGLRIIAGRMIGKDREDACAGAPCWTGQVGRRVERGGARASRG